MVAASGARVSTSEPEEGTPDIVLCADEPPDKREGMPSTKEEPQQDPRPRAQTRPTTRLDPSDLKPSWPIAIATLEQLAGWSVLALRLGTLALIQECVRDLALRDARKDTIVRLRALVEALAHMPFDA